MDLEVNGDDFDYNQKRYQRQRGYQVDFNPSTMFDNSFMLSKTQDE
ncbi:MAG: hypothetical protein IPH28_23565 [Cytophagaceae bacterium]|nr:hypothetical protein [Cytophagaceae bacterium]